MGARPSLRVLVAVSGALIVGAGGCAQILGLDDPRAGDGGASDGAQSRDAHSAATARPTDATHGRDVRTSGSGSGSSREAGRQGDAGSGFGSDAASGSGSG